MTEKRFVYYEHKGADYILDTPNKSLDFIEMLGDCLEAEEIVDLLNCLYNENEQLKQQLKSIEDSFKFSCTENHIEFNKDKLKVEDTHTKLTLKDGKLCIYVFIPQLNEYVKFFYLVTGRKMEREFINYEGDV